MPDGLRDPALLAAAPLAVPPEPIPVAPTRLFLMAVAGGSAIALPVEDVTAVLPPLDGPPPRPGGVIRGLAAHRGDVLPVLDAGERLGATPVLRTGRAVPMLRLSGAAPVAIAVTSVGGLRAVPVADIVAVPGDGVVAALARVDGYPVPVLRARALGALPSGVTREGAG